MNREWLFIHGWGYGADAWDPWIPLLPLGDVMRRYDRGYFGQPQEAVFETGLHRVLVTHSLGLAFYDPSAMGECDEWIVIGGFTRFHADEGGKRVTRRMRDRLATEPLAVVREFRKACGDALTPIPTQMDPARLATDLNLLDRVEAPISLMREIGKISILHARADTVVPPERAAGMGFPVITHPDAHHALSYTHARWCWTSSQQL
jgi:hypothetical protein